jgi:hypothetical protein
VNPSGVGYGPWGIAGATGGETGVTAGAVSERKIGVADGMGVAVDVAVGVNVDARFTSSPTAIASPSTMMLDPAANSMLSPPVQASAGSAGRAA